MSNIPELIDKKLKEEQLAGDGFRSHLGASVIGKECTRDIWYSFRWAKRVTHSGRILRLFMRGQNEEASMVMYLRKIGIEVSEVDADGKQWRILDVDGHFGGSLDGVAWKVPGFPDLTALLLEFKTHNTKSFANLVAMGNVQAAKPQHYVQMQIYMHKRQLPAGLYMAVNKNDDDLYVEIVNYDAKTAVDAIDRAREIVYSPVPPNRIALRASDFRCKFCDFVDICHYGEAMQKNCRTCASSRPVEDGKWECTKFVAIIPDHVIPTGCGEYEQLKD